MFLTKSFLYLFSVYVYYWQQSFIKRQASGERVTVNDIESGEDYDNEWIRIKQQFTWWTKTSGRGSGRESIYNTMSDNELSKNRQ